jgi:hypothetical protein
VHDAANNATVILSRFAAHIRRQVRLDLFPLLVAQPKQLASHAPTLRDKKVGLKESLSGSTLNIFIGFRP